MELQQVTHTVLDFMQAVAAVVEGVVFQVHQTLLQITLVQQVEVVFLE